MKKEEEKQRSLKARRSPPRKRGLRVDLFSFGYKFGRKSLPGYTEWGGFVFDCRGLPNPFWDPRLARHTGLEDPVIRFFGGKKEVRRFILRVVQLLEASLNARSQGSYTRVQVCFGCTGGKHRSVYIADAVRKILESRGRRVRLRHLDIAKS